MWSKVKNVQIKKIKIKIPLMAEGKEQRRVCKQDNVKCFFFFQVQMVDEKSYQCYGLVVIYLTSIFYTRIEE